VAIGSKWGGSHRQCVSLFFSFGSFIVFGIEVTYEIRVFFKGAQKEVFSSILKKSL
jgi:hypothetical protein